MSEAQDRTSLADRVHSAAIHLLRRLRKQDDASGLTPARLSALSVVVFGGPVTVGQLASAEQVAAPTMTRLVLGLERDGLVKRERDTTDARVIWIRATGKGERLLYDGRRRRVAELARDLDELPASDLRHLTRAAEILERISGRPATPSLGTPTPSESGARGASPSRARRRTR